MLDTQFVPKDSENSIYEFWLKHDLFKANPDAKAPTYTIVFPPPNVTGVLHMGHALTCTLEDILIRRKRMQGFNTLWVPGTDHAGIATQMVVERNLMKEEKKSRHDLGREKFLEKVWEWKEKSQETIVSQMRKMGGSFDWSRLAFTLDENISLAVKQCFLQLYNEGLIYRDMAIIQWCPRCHTALSDLEVKCKEIPGKFWHIKYRLKGTPEKFLVVATTRPETLLGDTAVAVHPEDERYAEFHGKEVMVPLIGRAIPVILDSYVDPQFGTGALKITPGHDPNDYVVGKRHGLPIINLMDENAVLNSEAGAFAGLDRVKARAKVLEELQKQNLLIKEEDHTHSVGHCDRCVTVVEPKVSQQWFVKAEELAKDALRAVENKEIRIVPEEWEKTYFEWMRNIRPWCISRQLWWGHRIPVWYCQKCQTAHVGLEAPKYCSKCSHTELKQDEDVLDTWFSSGLWPISTLGWPQDSKDLKAFYPTSVLETGFDILFFWVARMIMLGMKMTGKIPFHTVYLHPMVRDEQGQKMSKTKGNVVDPLEISDRLGTDALRFFLSWNAFHGRDMRVSEEGVENCKFFVNKIWNASRFVLMHFSDVTESKSDLSNEVNQWIWSRLNHIKGEVNRSLEQYRFFEAAQAIYHFIWSEYCDWFIEFIKSKEELESRKASKDSTAVEVLEEAIRLLHPFMPFVTEKLWQEMPIRDRKLVSVCIAKYPETDPSRSYPQTEERVARVIRLIEQIRTTRGVHQLSPAKEISLSVSSLASEGLVKELIPFKELIKKMAKLSSIEFEQKEYPKQTHLSVVMRDLRFFISKAELGDLTQELERKKKELQEKTEALRRADEKLRNERFMNSAPQAVKEGVLKQKTELKREVEALQQYLEDLS
ncbi:MAG: valine--tRNA ligase [Deltaproteobacteria bacterium]|nr:valine--tRNA ligase [Deltaproteobacteria bacterium]